MEECMVCFEERQDFKSYSCNHKLCSECYNKINNCPLCKSHKIEVVIIQPTTVVTSVQTTYNSLKCLICVMLTTLIFLYFYNP